MHETQFMKMFVTLPSFSANILGHILIGGRPVETIIHQRVLALLMNTRRKNGIELKVGQRQLAMKNKNSQSWFIRANDIAPT